VSGNRVVVQCGRDCYARITGRSRSAPKGHPLVRVIASLAEWQANQTRAAISWRHDLGSEQGRSCALCRRTGEVSCGLGFSRTRSSAQSRFDDERYGSTLLRILHDMWVMLVASSVLAVGLFDRPRHMAQARWRGSFGRWSISTRKLSRPPPC